MSGPAPDRSGQVALITGGAGGIGASVARRLAGQGMHVVVGDVDEEGGRAVAEAVGGVFQHCDVRALADNEALVATAVDRFGGLDIAFLNAGVSAEMGVGPDFDLEVYRRIMGINLDGVVFGVHAALPALRERGGSILATASLAGLTAVPMNPLYGANKHAVVGLVRSLGPALAPEGVRVNGLCPSFARTGIIGPIESLLEQSGVPILDVEAITDAVLDILDSDGTGECWYVVAGRPSEPFRFRGVPGPRTEQAGDTSWLEGGGDGPP
jgi:NAD(P)-dependent dehydrogenase (short-subunit alcohol dehydrogenase family)